MGKFEYKNLKLYKTLSFLPSPELESSCSVSSGTTSQYLGTLCCLTSGIRHLEHGVVEEAENEADNLIGLLCPCLDLFLAHFVSLDNV